LGPIKWRNPPSTPTFLAVSAFSFPSTNYFEGMTLLKKSCLLFGCALTAASTRDVPAQTAGKALRPGLYYNVRESMTKDLEAASFIEYHADGTLRIAKKITRECWAAEVYGRIDFSGDAVKIAVDSSLGNLDSDSCASDQELRKSAKILSGRLIILGDNGFKLCLGSESKCGQGSRAFAEYSLARPKERSPF
jgi:hypothetical protein